MVTSKDGNIWVCDPYYNDNWNADVYYGATIISSTKACTDPSDVSTCSEVVVYTMKNIVPGCIESTPMSLEGGYYWYTLESQTFFSVADFVDDEIITCPFMDGWFYSWDDMVVGSDDIIYECWDM